MLGAIISALGAVIRNVEVGLFIPHGDYWLAKGNTPTALFPLLFSYLFTFPRGGQPFLFSRWL